MFKSRDVFGFALVAVFVTAFIMVGLTSRVEEPMKVWFGTIGILPFSAAVATVAMLFVSAAHNEKMLEQARRTERTTRFQKAAELLGGAAHAPRSAGCHVLSELAVEDRIGYQDVVVRTLRSLISDHTTNVIRPIFALKEDAKISDIPDLPQSIGISSPAIGALARIPVKDRWLGTASPDGTLRLWGVLLHNSLITRSDFSKMNFAQAVIQRCSWEDCRAENMSMNARVRGYLVFRRCYFRDVDLVCKTMRGRPLPDKLVRFEDCTLINVKLNGVLI